MKNLVIEKTENTPGVLLSATDKLIEFIGESRPENVKLFFEPIYTWLTDYGNYLYFFCQESKAEIKVIINFKLEYFNSSSAKFFIDVIKLFNKYENEYKNLSLSINWFFEEGDDDLKEAGEEMITMTGIKMNIVNF